MEGTPLNLMERTLKIGVRGRVTEFRRRNIVEIFEQEESSDLIAVWQKDSTDTWFATFNSTEIVKECDGREITCNNRNITLYLSAAGKLTVRGKLH